MSDSFEKREREGDEQTEVKERERVTGRIVGLLSRLP